MAVSLLLVGYAWTMFAIASACMGAGLAVGQCLQRRLTRMPNRSSAGSSTRWRRGACCSAGASGRSSSTRRCWRSIPTTRWRSPRSPTSTRSSAASATRSRCSTASLQLSPDDAEAHFNRGFLLQERNDHEGALAAFDAALAINPDHDRALYGIALSLISTRRLEEALAPLKKNTKLQPMSPYGWYQLARVQHDLGRTDEAQKVLDHLAKFEPKVARQLERETGLKASTLS